MPLFHSHYIQFPHFCTGALPFGTVLLLLPMFPSLTYLHLQPSLLFPLQNSLLHPFILTLLHSFASSAVPLRLVAPISTFSGTPSPGNLNFHAGRATSESLPCKVMPRGERGGLGGRELRGIAVIEGLSTPPTHNAHVPEVGEKGVVGGDWDAGEGDGRCRSRRGGE